jgi:VCBS repeat-containing protein
VYPVTGGGILFTKEPLEKEAIESVLEEKEPPEEPISSNATARWERYSFPLFLLVLCLFLSLDMLSFYLLSLTLPTATITIIPASRNISTTAQINLASLSVGGIQGRALPGLTISQSQTVQATGKGHQTASFATGNITFYNGLLTPQSVPAGTILTGSDGAHVITTQEATIPAAMPPTEGAVTAPARAVHIGYEGNIAARDINAPCCLTSVLAVNLASFQGGQNARDFTFVTKEDLQDAASSLKIEVSKNVQSALMGELHVGEAFVTTSCTPVVRSDHQIGRETKMVTVSASVSCNAVAYNSASLQDQATQVIAREAMKRLGTRYVLYGAIQAHMISVSLSNQPGEIARITLSIQGTWIYQFTPTDETRMKQLLEGRGREDAIKLLSTFPGVQRISIVGVNDNNPLPTDPTRIHLFYGAL